MRASIVRLVLCAVAALGLAGCDNTIDGGTPTTPTTPTPNVTETFTGVLTPNAGITHAFTVAAAGGVTVTVTAVAPDSTTTIGVYLGTWNGASCVAALSNDSALQGAYILGNVSSAGQLCARVYDVGKITGPVNYTIDVNHP